MMRLATSAALMATLAACGGGGSGSGGSSNPTQNPDPSIVDPTLGSSVYDTRLSNVQQRSLLIEDQDPVALTTLAAAGSATYTGESFLFSGDFGGADPAAATTDGRPTLAGLVSITTTFDADGSGVLSGEITDFVDQNDVEKTGSLVISEAGLVDAFAGGLTPVSFGDISGTISGSGDGNGTYESRVLTSVYDGFVTGAASSSQTLDPTATSDDFVLTFNAEQ